LQKTRIWSRRKRAGSDRIIRNRPDHPNLTGSFGTDRIIRIRPDHPEQTGSSESDRIIQKRPDHPNPNGSSGSDQIIQNRPDHLNPNRSSRSEQINRIRNWIKDGPFCTWALSSFHIWIQITMEVSKYCMTPVNSNLYLLQIFRSICCKYSDLFISNI
jgi:hypothetical protein